MELQPGPTPTALLLVTVMVILTHVTRLTVHFRTFAEVPPDTKGLSSSSSTGLEPRNLRLPLLQS